MLKGTLAYAVLFILLVAGLTLDSCASSKDIAGRTEISRKNIRNSRKPKVIRLHGFDCPWHGTYVIKNESNRKEYGPKYAKKQNRRLK